MKMKNVVEAVRRKRVVRNKKVQWKKYSTREGYKVVGGKEKRITHKEKRRRKLAQRKAKVKRRTKRASSNRKRMRSMKKRSFIREANEATKKVIDHLKKHGEGANQPDDKYDPKELAKGIKVEYEHTPNREAAKEIAKDHLEEIPDYYTRLAKMEKRAKEEMEEEVTEKTVMEFLRNNPNPKDSDVHAWADKLGVSTHKIEKLFYRLATKYALEKK